MSDYPYGAPRRDRRPRRGRRVIRALLLVVIVAAAFAVGIALGKALNDGPSPAQTVTYMRTLEPLPQQPAGSSP